MSTGLEVSPSALRETHANSSDALRVLAQTAYPATVASARVRVASYTGLLRDHGLRLDFRPTLSARDYLILSGDASSARKAGTVLAGTARAVADQSGHDLLLVHRLRFLVPLPGLDPPRHLDAYDLDDALFVAPPGGVNQSFLWVKQEARRCIACIRRARLVIAGNDFLAARAKEYARRVEVIPTCVDPSRQPLHQHQHPGPVTVGWIGSPSTVPYLQPLLPVLAALNRRRTVARLVVVGGDTGMREPWVEHRRWDLDREPEALASFDVGVMPLPDTAWARGKCGYKLLQYFSAGVPAVASPVGVSARLLADGRGLAASSVEQWQTALAALIEHPDERRDRGAAARAFVERDYSYRRWGPEMAALLRSLAA